MFNPRLLSIYLNDHWAGSTGGAELAKRAAGANEESEYGPELQKLAEAIEEDREALSRVMDDFDVGKDPVKQAGGWLAEKVGRAKLNGQLVGYSPLSRLVELEGLHLGVSTKLSLWQILRANFGPRAGGEDMDALIARAESQLSALEDLRMRASAEAFAEEEQVASPAP
jgi:hypothetical protein